MGTAPRQLDEKRFPSRGDMETKLHTGESSGQRDWLTVDLIFSVYEAFLIVLILTLLLCGYLKISKDEKRAERRPRFNRRTTNMLVMTTARIGRPVFESMSR